MPPRRCSKPAQDGKARVLEIGEGDHGAHLLAVEQLGVDAVQAHGVAAAGEGVALRVRVKEVEHAALAHHHVEVELPLQSLPQLHRPLVEGDVAGQQVVGADDGGVAADVAGAEVALLDDRDVA